MGVGACFHGNEMGTTLTIRTSTNAVETFTEVHINRREMKGLLNYLSQALGDSVAMEVVDNREFLQYKPPSEMNNFLKRIEDDISAPMNREV